MGITYLQDKAIIDWICALEKALNEYPMINLGLYGSYALGYYSYFYMDQPSQLKSLIGNFLELDIHNQQGSNQKIILDLIIEPILKLRDDLNSGKGHSTNNQNQYFQQEESKSNIKDANLDIRISIVKGLITETDDGNNTKLIDQTMSPIDLIYWGFLSNHYSNNASITTIDILNKVKMVRGLQSAQLMKHNQKMRTYVNLYQDFKTDVNGIAEKLMVNPNVGLEPLSKLQISDKELNQLKNQIKEQKNIEQKIKNQSKQDLMNPLNYASEMKCNLCNKPLVQKFMGFKGCLHCVHVECAKTEYDKRQDLFDEESFYCTICGKGEIEDNELTQKLFDKSIIRDMFETN